MRRGFRSRKMAVVELSAPIMSGTDSPAPRQTGIHKTGRAAMQIDDSVKTSRQEPQARFEFAACDQDFVYVRIAVKAVSESTFDKDGNAEFRELLFDRAHGAGQQQTVAH